MKHVLPTLATLAAATAGSCTAATEPTACTTDGGATTIALGLGDPSNPTVFRPLADGTEVELTPGNQGGQHVWVQVRASGICPRNPAVTFTITKPGASGAFLGYSTREGLPWLAVPGASGTYASDALAAQIDNVQYCSVLHGGSIVIDARLDDRAGHVLEANVRVKVTGWVSDAAPYEIETRESCCTDPENLSCHQLTSDPPDAATPAPDAGSRDDAGPVTTDGGDASDASRSDSP